MPRLSRCGKIQLPIAQGFTAAAELMRSSVPIRGAPLQNRGRRGTVGAGGGAGSACGSQNCFSSGNISRCHSWPQRHLHKDTSTPSLLFASSRSGLRTRCSFMRGGSSVGVASITLHSSHVTTSPSRGESPGWRSAMACDRVQVVRPMAILQIQTSFDHYAASLYRATVYGGPVEIRTNGQLPRRRAVVCGRA